MSEEYISDDYMRTALATTRSYTFVILHRASGGEAPDAEAVVWEHGRRNFELRREGQICIVAPVVKDGSDIAGIYIFSTDLETTRRIMEDDPAVEAGIFTYEVHQIRSFPGDALAR